MNVFRCTDLEKVLQGGSLRIEKQLTLPSKEGFNLLEKCAMQIHMRGKDGLTESLTCLRESPEGALGLASRMRRFLLLPLRHSSPSGVYPGAITIS